ncbi:hypothetical protein [Yinghuangia soli]|uniref:Lipoprotein n=1 Tax=Yinghuangia soli TaxID=2908204 RepID=A0AA41TYC5_9ACTN|nr:hypothetical protein [Yinghuangia soli]MCF2526020.1 hypothetical protein [Yinghuangia soli]
MRRGVSVGLALAGLLSVLTGCSRFENRNDAFPDRWPTATAPVTAPAPGRGTTPPVSGAPGGGVRPDALDAAELLRRARLAVADLQGLRIRIGPDARSGISLVDAGYNPRENTYTAIVVSGRFTRDIVRIGPDAWVSASMAYWMDLGWPESDAQQLGDRYVAATVDPNFDAFEVLLEQSVPEFVLTSWDGRPEKVTVQAEGQGPVTALKGRAQGGELTVHLTGEAILPSRAIFTGSRERSIEYSELGIPQPVLAPLNPVFPTR